MTPDRARPARVLVVDDDPDDIHLLTSALHALPTPTHVESATNGAEALRLLKTRTEPPDLVLLDLKMPGMSGLETLDALRADPRLADLPVAVLSGSERDADRRESLARGAHAYLVKPTGVAALAALAASVEERWLRPPRGRNPPAPAPKAP